LAVPLAASLVAAACGDDDDGDTDAGGDGGNAAASVPECLTTTDLYAIFGPESADVSTWADAGTKAEELGSATEFPTEGELQIYGPGTESGTYDAFVELAIEDIAAEQGVAEDEIGVGVQYTSSPEDNAIVSGVTGADGTLGWVGYAFYEESADDLRAVSVDGGDGCVEPSVDTIRDESYPLTRPLYIYVSTANLADKPELAAFVDLFLNDGYTAVEDAGYVGLSDEQLAETQSTFNAVGADPGSGELSGDISVVGSSTVEPIANLVAEQFIEENPDVSVSVDGPGTGDGFELFCNGETDVSTASRAIEPDDGCEESGQEYVELLIGLDGITVMTKA
jgi:ABC-type phosphate transport system substrate-binding protein